MTDKYNSQQLFTFLSDHQDTIKASTARDLIEQFGADFDLSDVI